jgi:transposase-like protein
MNTHKLARLTPRARATIVARVRGGTPVTDVAHGMGVSRQTVYKWLRRAAAKPSVDGSPATALADRSSRPHHSPQRMLRYRRRQILRRRRQCWSSRRIAQYYLSADI